MLLFEPYRSFAVDVVRTYLELTDRAKIRPARPPRVEAHIARQDPPDGAISRWFYEHVGADYHWTDNLHRSDAEWQDWGGGGGSRGATNAGDPGGHHEVGAEGGGAGRAPFPPPAQAA